MRKAETFVKVAHAEAIGSGGVLVTLGLGSCVAVLLHDPVARVAGLAHALLPEPRPGAEVPAPTKFVTTAVPFLVDEMERLGAKQGRLVAKLVGGASMFTNLTKKGTLQTGERNIVAARTVLADLVIPILTQDVGREHGRSVRFSADDGRAVVSSFRFGEIIL